MPITDDNLLKRLLVTFKAEAQEHIQAIAAGLIVLEQTVPAEAQAAALDAIFRAAHSLKGAARTVNVTDIEALCQSLESTFAALKRGLIVASPELFDLLHRTAAALGELLQFIGATATTTPKPTVTELLHALQLALHEGQPPKPTAVTGQSPQASTAAATTVARSAAEEKYGALDTIRVATTKLDAVLLEAEELLAAKLAVTQHRLRLRHCQTELSAWRKRWAKLRPDLKKVRQTFDLDNNSSRDVQQDRSWLQLLEFLEWNQDFVESFEAEFTGVAKTADHDQRVVGTLVDSLLDDMKKIVMQPFATLLDVFPRFVRELSREQGKEVELLVRGDAIEIDRRILEEMKDPLIHLLRNSLDHGIETPAVRTQQGKAARGTLSIDITAHNGSNVELLFSDDGVGIDASAVKAAAVKLGLATAEKAETLSVQEALFLIFQSGVSTSPIITDISGRGLGLAIVKEKVEKLNGALFVETELGKGTRFRIILPLTLARFRGVLVRVGEYLFVLPTSNVEQAVRVAKHDIKTVENRETIVLSGQALSLARLSEVLNLTQQTEIEREREMQLVVVLAASNLRIAFIIDEVLNEQEVLVKSLGKQLTRVRNIAGATVLGSGKVVPILNVPDLLRCAVRASATGVRAASIPISSIAVKKKSVLVAEDSITSRTLLKNILETAGYRVETAVDGIEGYTKLRSGTFDLVVSDVEMPRMDGFGLTSKVRADKKLTELPVVLVTALESREDREHGIDVGANAYLVKSSFDQSNLLEVVRRLI